MESVAKREKVTSRALTIRNIFDKKFKTFEFDGVWNDVFSDLETSGIVLVYGVDKNGKTWFSLMFAKMLSHIEKVLYVSAEEGARKAFVDNCRRAGITPANRSLLIEEYIPIDELSEKLSKRKSARIVFIDNMTIYNDELKNGVFRQLLKKHSDKLFVFIAHEERGEPYTATAKLCRKLADVIVHVKGLACFVSGRVPGGTLTINEEKATLFHGQSITNT